MSSHISLRIYVLMHSASTHMSNISAISFLHKLKDWVDPGDTFVAKKMLTGAKTYKGLWI